jgi:hypothetical protein
MHRVAMFAWYGVIRLSLTKENRDGKTMMELQMYCYFSLPHVI